MSAGRALALSVEQLHLLLALAGEPDVPLVLPIPLDVTDVRTARLVRGVAGRSLGARGLVTVAPAGDGLLADPDVVAALQALAAPERFLRATARGAAEAVDALWVRAGPQRVSLARDPNGYRLETDVPLEGAAVRAHLAALTTEASAAGLEVRVGWCEAADGTLVEEQAAWVRDAGGELRALGADGARTPVTPEAAAAELERLFALAA